MHSHIDCINCCYSASMVSEWMGGVPLKWAVMFRMVSSLLNVCLTYTHPGNFHHPPHLSCRWQTGFGELGGELLISSKAAFVERKMVNTWIFGQWVLMQMQVLFLLSFTADAGNLKYKYKMLETLCKLSSICVKGNNVNFSVWRPFVRVGLVCKQVNFKWQWGWRRFCFIRLRLRNGLQQ